MGARLIPLQSGSVVFALSAGVADGPSIRGRWTRHRIRYTGASWGFQKSIVTWRLFDARTRRRLHLIDTPDDDDDDDDVRGELILDDSTDHQLIRQREPLIATRRRNRLVIPYTLSGSNHFGSCVLWRELHIDLARNTVTVIEKSGWVDIDR